MIMRSKNLNRDWTDDFVHENGNYLCTCWQCHREFAGNKHRMICKVCDTSMLVKVFRKYGIQWQVGGFSLLPWHDVTADTYGEIDLQSHTGGWLWFQSRWTTVKRKDPAN